MSIGKTGSFVEERHEEIITLVQKNRKIAVPELCHHFGVSASTIRNDLRQLRDTGLITRTHGGAIIKSKVGLEISPKAKETSMIAQKIAIAKSALGLVEDGDSIAISTGTTTAFFLKELVNKKKLTVVVNDLRNALFLEENTDFTIYMLGGIVRKKFHYVHLVGNNFPNICLDKMFFSCNALNAQNGATIPDVQLAANLSLLAERASEKILLCDSSKIGSTTFARIATLSELDYIVTDDAINKEDIAELEIGTQGAPKIIVAEV